MRVKVFGGQMLGSADDGVDLVGQLLGLLLQLLMLLHTETQQGLTGLVAHLLWFVENICHDTNGEIFK